MNYFTYIFYILFYIAWIIIINKLTFNRSLIHYLFVLVYILAILPFLIALINFYFFGKIDLFNFYISLINPILALQITDILNEFIINSNILFFLLTTGIGLLLIKLSTIIAEQIKLLLKRKQQITKTSDDLILLGTMYALGLAESEELSKEKKS